MTDMMELDGGAGGGQILRTALSLSMITGRPFRIADIRAKRSKPGLMRQHLAAVTAAAAISGATVDGAHAGSTALEFIPGRLQGGDHEFAIGSAGSVILVLQTLIPAMLLGATQPFRISISGGTHNPMAPCADFLEHCFMPVLHAMGASLSVELERHGFYPAGGGRIRLSVSPCTALRPLALVERGALRQASARAIVANLPAAIARRELQVLHDGLGWNDAQLQVHSVQSAGPGNVLSVMLEHEHTSEIICAYGVKSVAAEEIAQQALQQVSGFLDSSAAVGEHLADQLMLPFALAGSGRFTAPRLSAHMASNAHVIERFLPVRFEFAPGERCVEVMIHGDAS